MVLSVALVIPGFSVKEDKPPTHTQLHANLSKNSLEVQSITEGPLEVYYFDNRMIKSPLKTTERHLTT